MSGFSNGFWVFQVAKPITKWKCDLFFAHFILYYSPYWPIGGTDVNIVYIISKVKCLIWIMSSYFKSFYNLEDNYTIIKIRILSLHLKFEIPHHAQYSLFISLSPLTSFYYISLYSSNSLFNICPLLILFPFLLHLHLL